MQSDVELINAESFARAPGGAPANVAVGLARLGRTSGFIGKVGADPFGDFLRRTLEREGVDVSCLGVSKDAHTTLAFVSVRSNGANDFVFFENSGADQHLSGADVSEEFIESSKIFHFGSIGLRDESTREATWKALRLAETTNSIRSFDPNYRPALWASEDEARRRIWEGIARSDLVKISDAEWEVVCATEDFRKGAERLIDAGVKIIVQSRGEKGAAYYCAGGQGEVRGFGINVVDTTGAGDAFVASILANCLERNIGRDDLDAIASSDLTELLTRANAAGAIAATRYGAIPGLPSTQEVQEFLANQ
jgi:fructokinase